MEEYLYTSIS